MLDPRLIRAVLSQYLLHPRGVHGVGHWVRVRANGLWLAEQTGVRVDVVELFALLHDSRRFDEDTTSSTDLARPTTCESSTASCSSSTTKGWSC